MAVDIVIPTVAESVTSGVIAKWNKKDGESVKRDETVLELETDKVTMEVAATAAGASSSTAGAVGTTVAIGQVVGTVDENAAKPRGARPRQRRSRRRLSLLQLLLLRPAKAEGRCSAGCRWRDSVIARVEAGPGHAAGRADRRGAGC